MKRRASLTNRTYKLTDQQRDEVAKLYAEGQISVMAIAAMYGISKAAVVQIARRRGIGARCIRLSIAKRAAAWA